MNTNTIYRKFSKKFVSIVLISVLLLTSITSEVFAATYTLSVVPLTNAAGTPDLINPFKGYHKWRSDSDVVPLPENSKDAYNRYEWRNLESSQGNYNFSSIIQEIQNARSRGQRFSFRIRSLIGSSNGRQVPDYIMSTSCAGGLSSDVPNWNSACYLDNAERLLNALSAEITRQNLYQWINWVDIGLYGKYGEWADDAGVSISQASRERLVDMHIAAFSGKQLLIFFLYGNSATISYAFNKNITPPIGWRIDCLGEPGYFNQWGGSRITPFVNRWQVAPAVAELCGGGGASYPANWNPTESLNQLTTYHVSSVSNGNFSFSALTQSDRDTMYRLGKVAGYRLQVNSVTLPNPITAGSAFTLSSSWSNLGSAPAYEQWNVVFQLKNASSGALIWETTLPYNLKSLTGLNNPATLSAQVTVPTSVSTGTYTMSFRIENDSHLQSPIRLANNNSMSDGSYQIGTVNVSSSGAPTFTATPSPTNVPSLTPGQVRGDADGDRDVDEADYTIWVTRYLNPSLTDLRPDFNKDGKVDGSDYSIWLNNFGRVG